MEVKRGRRPVGVIRENLAFALQRLISGTPTNEKLAEQAKQGLLKINPSTVALEARCSRTLISHAGCPYPEIREAILRIENPISAPTRLSDVCNALRKENVSLLRELKLARAQCAALVRRLDLIEREHKRALSLSERRANRPILDAEQVAGATVKNECSVVLVPADKVK